MPSLPSQMMPTDFSFNGPNFPNYGFNGAFPGGNYIKDGLAVSNNGENIVGNGVVISKNSMVTPAGVVGEFPLFDKFL